MKLWHANNGCRYMQTCTYMFGRCPCVHLRCRQPSRGRGTAIQGLRAGIAHVPWCPALARPHALASARGASWRTGTPLPSSRGHTRK